ncbi:MAG: hypothetical protein ACW96U_09210 [Candidatus Heimdallarchaeaceae archaeon]|jgi:hypothetical protein
MINCIKSKALMITLFFISVLISSGIQSENSTNIIGNNFSKLEDHQSIPNLKPQQTQIKLDENFGDQKTFLVYTAPLGGSQEQITATLLAIGEWCYVYIDNTTIDRWGYNESIAVCTEVRDNFDTITYPKGIEFAGHPNGTLGDIDGDPKVTVLIIDNEQIAGGRYSSDSLNNREMIYIYTGDNPDLPIYLCMSAHEFNHLIWYNTDIDGEMASIKEGYADYASYYSGYVFFGDYSPMENMYNGTLYALNFSDHPEQSLLYFDTSTLEIALANYGKASTFVFYLCEKYGEELISDLIKDDVDGPAGIETALANAGYDITFNDLFLDWITACTINELSIENGIYGFENADFITRKITIIDTLSFTKENVNYQQYGFEVVKLINPTDEFSLEISNPNPLAVGVSAAIYDANGWSITQAVIKEENGDTIISHFTGENIQYAYIITSLMNENTPTLYSTVYLKCPSKQLTYSFFEGHKKASFNFLSFSILLFFLSTLIVITRRRKQI